MLDERLTMSFCEAKWHISTEINMAQICKHWSTALQLYIYSLGFCSKNMHSVAITYFYFKTTSHLLLDASQAHAAIMQENMKWLMYLQRKSTGVTKETWAD